jgi:hypothetical protein
MLLAYLPPELKTTGRPYASNDYLKNLQGVDILTDQLGSGFSSFPAPSTTCVDPLGTTVTVKPDYSQNDIAGDPLIDPKPAPLQGVVPIQASSTYTLPYAVDNRRSPTATRATPPGRASGCLTTGKSTSMVAPAWARRSAISRWATARIPVRRPTGACPTCSSSTGASPMRGR